jgi:rare lipoprotein A
MANGCRFDPNKLTAASKTLRLGSAVRVRSLRTGLSTTVYITDRGPYYKNRIIDLSYAAAKAIGAVKAGVVPVQIELLPDRPVNGCNSG